MLSRVVRSLSSLLLLKRNPVAFARRKGVIVGDGCDFINLRTDTFGSEAFLIHIGNRVTLSGPIRFITHDGGVRVFAAEHPTVDVVAPIVIEDGAFVGVNAIILPGVTIGRGAVVGAGSVVTRSVPPGAVVAGNPARVVKTREEYLTTSLQKSVGTRQMSAADKRRTLLARFGAAGSAVPCHATPLCHLPGAED
jgi:acetyltransferase-like isoleucine patch superfamily enzyme